MTPSAQGQLHGAETFATTRGMKAARNEHDGLRSHRALHRWKIEVLLLPHRPGPYEMLRPI
jgi:hypothetical protein